MSPRDSRPRGRPRSAASRRSVLAALVLSALLVPAFESLSFTRWNLHVAGRLRQANRRAPDTDLDRRFRQLIPHIPSSGNVGLLLIGAADVEEEVRVHFFLQYSLAPRHVVRSTEPEFVIAVGPAASKMPDDPALALVRSFDETLHLFRRVR